MIAPASHARTHQIYHPSVRGERRVGARGSGAEEGNGGGGGGDEEGRGQTDIPKNWRNIFAKAEAGSKTARPLVTLQNYVRGFYNICSRNQGI